MTRRVVCCCSSADNFHSQDLDVHKRPVVVVARGLFDVLHDVHTLKNPTKHRVLAIEPGTRDSGDEELRPVRVRARIRHGEREGTIVLEGPVEFVLEFASPNTFSASAIALWISSLDHEALDDSVEDDAVVITIVRMNSEILDCLRALLVKQLDDDVSHGGVDGGLLPERVVRPDGGRDGGVLLGRFLVEDVSSEVGAGLGRLPRAENEEAWLLVGGDKHHGVRHLLVPILVHDRDALLDLFLHGLPLKEGHRQEALCLLDLAQHPHELVGVHIDDLDSNEGREDQEVARLVESHLLQHVRWTLPQLLLHRYPSPEVEAIEVQLLHVRVTLGRCEHLERLVVGSEHLASGESKYSESAVVADSGEHAPVRANGQRDGVSLVLEQLVEVCVTFEAELEALAGRPAGHREGVRIPQFEGPGLVCTEAGMELGVVLDDVRGLCVGLHGSEGLGAAAFGLHDVDLGSVQLGDCQEGRWGVFLVHKLNGGGLELQLHHASHVEAPYIVHLQGCVLADRREHATILGHAHAHQGPDVGSVVFDKLDALELLLPKLDVSVNATCDNEASSDTGHCASDSVPMHEALLVHLSLWEVVEIDVLVLQDLLFFRLYCRCWWHWHGAESVVGVVVIVWIEWSLLLLLLLLLRHSSRHRPRALIAAGLVLGSHVERAVKSCSVGG
mmetsp:Transcript_75896/g.158259  ORF Transcript_75896/g.158259 Transcript_75896/m.158259 type:complete len:672 (+) Transcript_75896:34-2049(+)